MHSARHNLFKSAVKHSLSRFGVEIRLTGRRGCGGLGRVIPFESTLQAASEAGLSVCDYVDVAMNGVAGATQATIDRMRELNVFERKIGAVVEIGPGTGRYTQKTIEACSPEHYEFYETSIPWAQYVERTYGAFRQPATGWNLAASASDSADLVQAHQVFSALDLMTTLRYWPEMARVTRSGGFVVFDVVTEACLDPDTVDKWTGSGLRPGSYLSAVPRDTVLRYFDSQGLSKVGTFLVPMGPGSSEVFVLRKR